MDELTIEPSKEDHTIVVTVATTFTLHTADDSVREQVEAARTAALSSTDPWSIRFARLNAQEERVTYAKRRGALESVTRSARVPPDDLQNVFSDANITVDVLGGEGWRELTFYPGSSGRATREQRQRFDADLARWSEFVADYFTAMGRLYAYLDDAPERAPFVFGALQQGGNGSETATEEEEAPVTEEEQALVMTEEEQRLVHAVGAAMGLVLQPMIDQEGRLAAFAEDADLIFNPFPARIVVRPPADVLSSEGFTNAKDTLAIEPVNLFDAIAALEGHWISPDPLAMAMREQEVTAEEMAALPRQSRPVVSSLEVARALTEKLTRPRTYRVRWRD